MKLWHIVSIAMLTTAATFTMGCADTCNDPCGNDAECDDEDLVCYSGKCAPRECKERCASVGVNICQFDRFCNYLGCN